MKKQKKLVIIIVCLMLLIGGGLFFIKSDLFSFLKQNSSQNITVAKDNLYTFPDNNPQFSVKISSKKTSSSSSYIRQHAITIYRFGSEQKKSIFQRNFFADEFKGEKLTYEFATDSASFSQQGILETFGCPKHDCSLVWTNFYIWNAKQNTFVLDNASHKDAFAQLLTDYKTIDNNGCQNGQSFSTLYQQNPKTTSYCNETHGIASADLVFFLQTEKVIQKIINGENLSSNNIKATSL